MLSRVAENLYWMGRYLERAENVARLADVTNLGSVEAGIEPAGDEQTWAAVIIATGAASLFEDARASDPSITPGGFLILSPDNPNSLRANVGQARRTARELREHISREVWEEINRLHLTVQQVDSVSSAGMHDFYNGVKRSIAGIYGLFDNTVLLDEGRDWFRCGLFIERADMSSRIIDAKYFTLLPDATEVGGPIDRVQWMSVLRSASAWQAFRLSYRGPITGPRVASMLVLNERFPRSLLFCIRAFQRHYNAASARTPRQQSVHASRELAVLELDLSATDERSLISEGLHEFLDGFQQRLTVIDQHLGEHIFRALPVSVR
ncbi:MAG: alpha-E domain-containing protein [Chloroflexi bacterium]|nr:alpha-E domain-containing protein [Chloroflexota bacterium]MDA1146058.1 alpha-E domain-containing protein [Chloroflexota bacterium]